MEKSKCFKQKNEVRSMGEWIGMDFASSTRAAENRIKWERIIGKSAVVP